MEIINKNVKVILMYYKTKIIFKYQCLIKKCREKGKFELAIKLKNKLLNLWK
jgi:hypothetical protein